MRNRARRILRKIHRTFGVLSAVFLMLLSVTGIALNHTQSLSLSSLSAPGFVSRWYYGDTSVEGYEIEGNWLYSPGTQLYLDATSVTECSLLAGATSLGDQYAALCDGEITLLTEEGELIERLGSTLGVPEGATSIGVLPTRGDALAVLVGDTVYEFDTLNLKAIATNEPVTVVKPGLVPGDFIRIETVSMEQFILDLHSGALFGFAGRWFVDFVGVIVLLLALSGLNIWLNTRR